MERYKVILAYDGTAFFGSQRQKETRTVQSVVEAALKKLNWGDHSVIFSGRTDTGVHAMGQVVAFDLEWNHSCDDLARALNSLLPTDVAVREISIAPADFHPRFDALSRCYRYRVFFEPLRNPLLERFSWRVWPAPNMKRMNLAAQALLGRHDFSAFGRATSPNGSTIREVLQAEWQQQDDELIFITSANAFLYHMVRRMVHALVQIGQDLREIKFIGEHLQNPDEPPIQGLAPPQGLALAEVVYPSKMS
jgi:tRNA pseudouridine38-40 synthase